MTIVVLVKVHDGLVIAADSASTMLSATENTVSNIYNNANKVFCLYKGLPIGGLTWGAGSIGQASISTLAKDLRRRFMGNDSGHLDWKLDESNYTLEKVAQRTREFLFDELYSPLYGNVEHKPTLGFIVGGYSANQSMAEEWLIAITRGVCPPPSLIRPSGNCGILGYGMIEPVHRMIAGFDLTLEQILRDLSLPQDTVDNIMNKSRNNLYSYLYTDPMPIQDAIDLAEFLVHTAKMYWRFMPGASSVGGPIDIAAITKHEGFKWVCRKFYFNSQYNPGD